MTYRAEEEDDSGIHMTHYNVTRKNSTHIDLTKKWTSDDYLKHADGRPVEGIQHSKSHYHSTVKIEDSAIKSVQRNHWSYLQSNKHYKSPLHRQSSKKEPDLDFKASGQSELLLIGCIKPSKAKRTKRYSENENNIRSILAALKRDNLTHGNTRRLKSSSLEENPKSTNRTFYELLRCYYDPSVKESELSKCVKEFHFLARNDDDTFEKIANLTLGRSHQNFSTWSGLVGALVVRGGHHTQKILAAALLSNYPRPLTEKEHSVLLEAVFFMAHGPLYPDLFQALVSLHKNESLSEEVSVRAMLVVSALVKRCDDAGYNRSLSDIIMRHLNTSFKQHPARYHDQDSHTHEAYLRNHLWAFGNLGHPSTLDIIKRHLDHDNSDIRHSAVSALRKLPSKNTDDHLLWVLKNDEHVTVKAAVIEVFTERRQNLTKVLREAIEDAMWKGKDGDEVDSAIKEFLESHGDDSYDNIKRLRQRRDIITRKKRALFPVLKPREFSLGPHKEWRKLFGFKPAGAEAIMRFINQVTLRIGIFGGKFEVNLDNLAHFRAHVMKWSFDVLKGKAAFNMAASFKNDLPKYLLNTIVDTADHVLARVDALSSIFTKHIQRFINKMKTFLPLKTDGFLDFITDAGKLSWAAIQSTRFGRLFSQIVKDLKNAHQTNVVWNKIANTVNKLFDNFARSKISSIPLQETSRFLNNLIGLLSKVSSELPRGFPINLNFKEFLKHIPPATESQENYFRSLNLDIPDNVFKMLHFKTTLQFPVSLDQLKAINLCLLEFANNFTEMFSVSQDIINIDFPKLRLPEFAAVTTGQQLFDFDLSFDWRVRFKFKVNFTSNNFVQLKNVFTYLQPLFEQLELPDVDLPKFFQKSVSRLRNGFNAIDNDIFNNTNPLSDVQWLRRVIQEFHNLLSKQDQPLRDFIDTSTFLKELAKKTNTFSKTAFQKVSKFQALVLKTAGTLQHFGEIAENKTIMAIRKIEDETQTVIGEIVNVTLFVDEMINNLKTKISKTAKEFVDTLLTGLGDSVENVNEFIDNVAEFTSSSSEDLTGFCHKIASFSGKVLDDIQSEAAKSVAELASFIASKSAGITDLTSRFKLVVNNVEKWHQKYLQKHLGKYAIVARTLEEFFFLLNDGNELRKTVYTISTTINDVVDHLDRLPEYARSAREAAEKLTYFATNARHWLTEVKKLNIQRRFKLDFDNKLRELCNEFQTLAQDSVKKIQVKELFKTFREFVTTKTDALVSHVVGILDLLKQELKHVQKHVEKISDSIFEVRVVLAKLRSFPDSFFPIQQAVGELSKGSDIKHVIDNFTNKVVKSTNAFEKQTYEEYLDLQAEVQAFMELIPDKWEKLSVRKCTSGSTCLSEAFVEQAKGIARRIKIFKAKFERKELLESLKSYKDKVEAVAYVVNKIKTISKLVKKFTMKDNVNKIKHLAGRITGKFLEEKSERDVQKGFKEELVKEANSLLISEHIKKATEAKEKIQNLIENVFRKFDSIYRDNIEPFRENLISIQQKLTLSEKLTKKFEEIKPRLQAVSTGLGAMTSFSNVIRDVVRPLEANVLDVFLKSSEFTNIFDNNLKYYGDKVKMVSNSVNSFLDKVTAFFATIQLRQKGLDIRNYKPWDQYPHCSQDICLRLLRRSSKLYLGTIFVWKFPHLDDLSVLSNTGKWLVPGLFDDFKVRAISQLSAGEMMLGMRGVASNEDKASLLVIVDVTSTVSRIVKIFQVQEKDQPFKGDMGGVVILKSLIWMSSGKSLYAVRLSDLRNSMSTTAPSNINIHKSKSFSYEVASISYDERDHLIWVLDSDQSKAYSHKVSPFGDILEQKGTLESGDYTRGLTIIRQFNVKYACVAKCALVAGYQCRLEFHNLQSDVLDESSLQRVVRTPTGLESVQTVSSETIVTTFSSGTFSEKDKIERIAGDFEDRFFKLKVPILTTGFAINENCLYFKLGGDNIIPPRRLFPAGEMKCGSRRKRSYLEQAMKGDVYTDKLEKHKRMRREATESLPCTLEYEGVPKEGSIAFIPEIKFTVLVFGIRVIFSFGADGHFSINYKVTVCIKDKQVKLALIPGAWVSVYGSISLDLFVVSAGVTIEVRILETYLIPEIGVRVDKWPLSACLTLKMQLTPLSMRIYLWYRFRLCVSITPGGWLGIRISISWCSKQKFAEWSWSMNAIHMTLFTNCKRNIDNTPPGVGVCTAKQIANKKYFVQWRGFTEDTKIRNYILTVGSMRQSGNDHYSIIDKRQSFLISDLEITHGRQVYVEVSATNDAGLNSRIAECPVFTAKRRSPNITFINDGTLSRDLDFQTDSTSIAISYGLQDDFSEIASIQWGISSSTNCTFSASEANVLSLTYIGESLSIKKTGMDLANGGKYYARVIVTNDIGLATIACSDGVVIDTTPPLSREFGVGIEESKFVPSLRRISGTFQSFVDNESPMTQYKWKLVDEDNGADIANFKEIPLTQKSLLLDGLNLIAGKKYTAILKGINAVGLYSIVNVSGIIPDDTIPVCEGPVHDVTSFNDDEDRDVVRQLSNLTVRFVCYDQDSGIKTFEAAVGTNPGGSNIHTFVDISKLLNYVSSDSKTIWVVFADVNITSLVRYYVTIRVTNNARLVRTVTSDGILVDTTAPTVLPSYVRDGYERTDQKYSKRSDVFPAHWENAFADAESGIGEYYVGLGTTPGSDNQSKFKSYGLRTKAIVDGGALESGRTYYVTVIGCNRVHMCVNSSTNGAMVDYIPPHSGLVISGSQGPGLKITWINKAAWGRWEWCPADRNNSQVTEGVCDSTSFYDKHSGIKQFGMSVFSHTTAELLTPIKTVGRLVVSGRHVRMPNGVFSVLVEAEDRAGVRSSSISKSFIVDTSPPEVVQLYHGIENQPLMFTRTKHHQFTAYFEITEDVSDIVTYSVSVGSYPVGEDIIPLITHAPLIQSSLLHINWTSHTITTLVNGRKYFITLKVTNSAGLFIMATSEYLIFDNEKPTVSHVFDGWGSQDSKYHLFPSIYRMHWHEITDASGIKETKVCLCSSQNENNCDIHPEVVISGKALSHSFTKLRLQSGVYCYALLQVIDNAGNLGHYWSNGALVDTTPPMKGKVNDGEGQDLRHQRHTNILHASWSGFTENETSIDHYELAFGTTKNTSDVQPFKNVGLVTSAASTNLFISELDNGIIYYAHVIAYNPLGIPSKVASSNGVLVDSTPPIFTSPVFDGAVSRFDYDYSSNDNLLSANWKCVDQESGLNQAFVGFGTQPGVQDVASFLSVLPYQTSYMLKNVTLSQGFRYFATIICTNKVGLQSLASSNGLTFDSTQPSLHFIHDGLNIHQDASVACLNSSISANWKFTDPQSNIVSHYVSIKRQLNGATILGPRYLSGSQNFIKLRLKDELKHGEQYFFFIRAKNAAGLNTTGRSNGFIVDATAPVCSIVHAATANGTRTTFVGQTNKLAVYFQCEDKETGLTKYQFAIKDIRGSQLVLPFHTIKVVTNISSLAVIDGSGKRIIRLNNGGSYQIGIRATNMVNLTSQYWTAGVTIDSTPPVFRNVVTLFQVQSESIKVTWQLSDNESQIESISWCLNTSPDDKNPKQFTKISEHSGQLIISGISFKHGKMHYVYLKATNKAKLFTILVTEGVLVDRTPPSVGRISADFVIPLNYDGNPKVAHGASFPTKWRGFMDKESGIKSFKWAVGLNKESTKALEDDSYTEIQFTGTLNGFVIKGLTVLTNTSYYICIKAANGVGLTATNCSEGVFVKLGKLTAGVVYDGPLSKDIDFQLDDRAVWLRWNGFEDPVYRLKKYEWCYGLASDQDDYQINCTSFTTVDPALKMSAHQFHNISLLHGQRYGVKVLASNKQDQTITAISDGFTVDRTPPYSGIIKIGGSKSTRPVFASQISAPVVSWIMNENESVMQGFNIGIGNAPQSLDLLPLTKLDGNLRSVNLDNMNFRVNHGMTFFVTVTGENVLGLTTSVVSPQVIVDWTPPISGVVHDGNGTEDIDFQVDNDHLMSWWSEFLDPESDVAEYVYCVGTRPDLCDAWNRTSVNLNLQNKLELELRHGVTYFVTVVAINGAGLSSTSSSTGVTIDLTPPIIQGFSLDSVVIIPRNVASYDTTYNISAISSDPWVLSATWTTVNDKESNIKRMSFCAGTVMDSCDIFPWTNIDPKVLSISITLAKPMRSGTIFSLGLNAENGAGLETTVHSNTATVDTSQPLKGTVKVGNNLGLVFLEEKQPLSFAWLDFKDPESGIKQYEWKICSASEMSQCVSPFANAGKRKNLVVNHAGLEPGKQYRVVLKAMNHISLETEAVSNPFVLDKTPPETGMVFDGIIDSTDLTFQSSSSEISANWRGFKDKESCISRYEICVGLRRGLCEQHGYTTIGLITEATIRNLNLSHNTTYYTSIRAVNRAGQTSFASSNGVITDVTSPDGGILRDGDASDIDVTVYGSFVSSNWDEFSDPESGVLEYVICAGSAKGVCDILPKTIVKRGFSFKMEVWPTIASGTTVYSTLQAHNKAGGVTEVHSDGVLIDSTPPNAGKVSITSSSETVDNTVYVTSGNDLCVSWNGFTDIETSILHYQLSLCSEKHENTCPITSREVNNRTSVCIDATSLIEGEKYSISVLATNLVGFTATAKSSGFVIDNTEPDIGNVIVFNHLGKKYDFISSVLVAQWNGFVDYESGIKEYFACVGTEPSLCDTTRLVSVSNSSRYSWSGLKLTHNGEYFVSVQAVNKAGYLTNFTSSHPISVDKTAPDSSLVLDGSEHGKDINYQQSWTHVAATWFTIEDPESDVIELTWCVGTKPLSCDLKSRMSIRTNQTEVSSYVRHPLTAGDKYYVTLEAVNGAGDTTKMVSDGVVIDYTPPTAGLVIDGKDKDVDYIKNGETIFAHWTGFKDHESGIKFYEFALCEKVNILICSSPFADIGKETNVSFSGNELVNDKEYVAIIRATNMVGLNVQAISNGFRVDSSAPNPGHIWIDISEKGMKDNEISTRWDNFSDNESVISAFEICLGKTQGGCEEKGFENVGRNTTYTITNVTLEHKQTYYVTLRAVNSVGLSTEISETVNIDLTAPELVTRTNDFSSKLEKTVEIFCEGDLIVAKWLAHEDKESGILMVEWCIETYGMCNIRRWENINVNLLTKSAVIAGSLTGIKVVVRITNGAGRYKLLNSPSCHPDNLLPPQIQVNEVQHLNDTNTDIDYQTSTEAILVAWSFANNGIIYPRVQVALTTLSRKSTNSLRHLWHGEPFVFGFVLVPPGKTHVIFSGYRLQTYTPYRAVVRVWDDFDRYTDSVSDGVVIAPDVPSKIQINATDMFLGTEQERWKKYFKISKMTQNTVEDIYYVSDALSVKIEANLDRSDKNQSKLKADSQISYEATVDRITSGTNEEENETVVIRSIFERSNVQDDFGVCCSINNKLPRTVYADKQFKSVQETTMLGASIDVMENGVIVASAKDAVYIFTSGDLENTHITLKELSEKKGFAKVRAKYDNLLVSERGKILLYKVDVKDTVKTTLQLIITNCNYTMKSKVEHCFGDDMWSLSEKVGNAFAYDGSDLIVVSGIRPKDGNGLVAVFQKQTYWQLHDVLSSNKNDPKYGQVIAVNKKLLVVLGGHAPQIVMYSKGMDDYWKNENKLSEHLSESAPDPSNVHLTDENELFIVSTKYGTLTIFKLAVFSGKVTSKCRYFFSENLVLTGSLDVIKGQQTVVAVGVMAKDRDGAELILYESPGRCVKIGGVITKTGLRYDNDGRIGPSVALAENYVIIGTPGESSWPTNYVQAGTGRLYVAMFCPRDFVRRKTSEFGHYDKLECIPCGTGEQAYAGFEEHCVNCSESICLQNSSSLSFLVSNCGRNPCDFQNNRSIIKEISEDNLTVTELAPSLENDTYFLSGSEQSYFIRISQTSESGVKTISDSRLFAIDNTSPEPGEIYDGMGSDTSNNCSANTTLGSTSQCSSRQASETDIDFTNNTAEISARWINFLDNESDIGHYYWCIGSQPLSDDIQECENVTGQSNKTLSGLFLQHNETYYVSVLVCNYAGLCTAKSTDGVLVDTTPPIIRYVRDGLLGPDINFQVFTNMLFGNWLAEDPESGVVSFEVGWGFSPGEDDVWEFQEIGNTSVWYTKLSHRDLVKGKRFYVTVRAINGAGLESEPVSSNGIVVGKTEFTFSKNDSGSFFFDTMNMNLDGSREHSEIGNTFGTLDVPDGAVDEEIMIQCYSLTEKELKNGTDDNTSVVDPEIVKPLKHFKLGNYSFQINAYEPTNTTLLSKYHFNKPITISLFYDVDQMLKGNKKVVSNEVTEEDIDPVLLLWDSKNQTWYDAAKTCPEPWTFVDRKAKLLKVKVCHLTQFALFWSFEAENGIIEFEKENNGSVSPPHAVYENDNSIAYNKERYGNGIILDVARRKGSTGTIQVNWNVTIQPNSHISQQTVSIMSGQLQFFEGQWNSSIRLQFVSLPRQGKEFEMIVMIGNTSGGATLGNFNRTKIIFPSQATETGGKRARGTTYVMAITIPTVAGTIVLIVMVLVYRN